ncbi:MarR family transcriptional regulator [Brevundimonas sp.]|jgi:DNA-binding MarR family transcriptional regulator|uniref:MarR family transcriptional regulator n=1 Tax=Brevundimonas sp. TaxID=1871086 RepID=UPI002E101813|nr:MarR family transcriptional regulator [Brevundimonas sp.]
MVASIAFRPEPNAEALSPDLVLDALYGIVAAAETLTRRFDARVPGMDGHAFTPFALRQLAVAGRRGLPQVELARLLRMSPSSATRLIDALEGRGVVRREPHPNDRRINQIVLTVVGKALIEGLLDDLNRLADGLDQAALSDFTRRLSQLGSIPI